MGNAFLKVLFVLVRETDFQGFFIESEDFFELFYVVLEHLVFLLQKVEQLSALLVHFWFNSSGDFQKRISF